MNEVNRLQQSHHTVSLYFDNPVLDTGKSATGIVWLHNFMILFLAFSPLEFLFKEFRQTFSAYSTRATICAQSSRQCESLLANTFLRLEAQIDRIVSA
jgi:hypothetical protein